MIGLSAPDLADRPAASVDLAAAASGGFGDQFIRFGE
jgi:hypothetical protein